MPFIRDVLDKYFITHNPKQSHSDASDWWTNGIASSQMLCGVSET